MRKVVSVSKVDILSKNGRYKDTMYEAVMDTGDRKKFPRYSTVKKIITTYGLTRWLATSQANKLTQEQIYNIVCKEWEYGKDAIANALFTAIFIGTDEEYAEEQRNIGSHIHSLIEKYLSGHEVDVEKEEQIYQYPFTQFKEYADNRKIEVLPQGVECELVSLEMMSGGTIDCVGYVDGKLNILDWKTSGAIYSDYCIQVAFYRAMWNENFPAQPINEARIIRIPKKEWHESTNKKTGVVSRRHDKLEELVIPHAKLDEFKGMFMDIRRLWGYFETANTPKRLRDYLHPELLTCAGDYESVKNIAGLPCGGEPEPGECSDCKKFGENHPRGKQKEDTK